MDANDVAAVFGALAQETRLAVLRLLITAGPNGLPAGEISERFELPPSTTSFHLSALERAGLTQSTRQSRQIIHAVRIAALRELIAFLTETCCAGHPELCGDIAHLAPAVVAKIQPMIPAFNVLFLCTKNSARSIMAEAILERVGGGRFRTYSAGSKPAPEPMPEVLEVLRRLGHDVSDLHCKSWDEFCGPTSPRIDFVIALCDMPQGRAYRDLASTAVSGEWPLPDPAAFKGSAPERAVFVNELHASLQRRIGIFAGLPFNTLDRTALKVRLDEIGGGHLAAPAGRSAMRADIKSSAAYRHTPQR